MNIEVLFFGMSKDLAGLSNTSMKIDHQLDVRGFREILLQKFPSFSEMDTFSIALNETYAEEDSLLKDRDTVAIIPPVSGG